MKQVLVTGGSGFIGQHLVDQLLQRGCQVRVLDPRPLARTHANVAQIRGSILDHSLLERACEGCDTLFHLAAIPYLWASDTNVFTRVNVDGTTAVLSAARKAGVATVVHTSTEVILRGWADPNNSALSPSGDLPPLSSMAGHYTKSKWRAESLARDAAQNGQDVRIVYPTMPVGPGDHAMTAPTAMLNQFLNRPPAAYLPCLFNLCPVEDIARGHILAAEKGQPGGRYLLGGDHLTMEQVMDLLNPHASNSMPKHRIAWPIAMAFARISTAIADITKNAPSAPAEGVRLVRHQRRADRSTAERDLDWHPGPAEDALILAIQWLKQRR